MWLRLDKLNTRLGKDVMLRINEKSNVIEIINACAGT